jgi:hypothetical protein
VNNGQAYGEEKKPRKDVQRRKASEEAANGFRVRCCYALANLSAWFREPTRNRSKMALDAPATPLSNFLPRHLLGRSFFSLPSGLWCWRWFEARLPAGGLLQS